MNENERRWVEIIRHPTRILTIGSSGSGKSATAYWLAEILSRVLHLPIYVYGIDPRRHSLYPPKVRHVGRGDSLPENAILIIDEAALESPARRSMSDDNVELANLAYKARHKNLTTIAVTQSGSELDRVLVESAEIIIVKKPRPHQAETDRPHLRPLLKEAEEAFGELDSSEDPRGWAYVEHPGGTEMLQTGLASWWIEELSHIMADQVLDTVHPRRLPKEKRIQIARDLFARGWSYSQIGRELKVAKTTAWHYVNGHPPRASTRNDTSDQIRRVGRESLTLHFSESEQRPLWNLLKYFSNAKKREWAAPLCRLEDGTMFSGAVVTLTDFFSIEVQEPVVGLAMPRRMNIDELQKWLSICATGVTWAGPKVEILVRSNTLELRTWPEGSQWYSEVLVEIEGKPSRLEVVARQRPAFEVLTPCTLTISANGEVEEFEEDRLKDTSYR